MQQLLEDGAPSLSRTKCALDVSSRASLARSSSSVADSLLASGVVSAAEETPGDNLPAPDDSSGGSR